MALHWFERDGKQRQFDPVVNPERHGWTRIPAPAPEPAAESSPFVPAELARRLASIPLGTSTEEEE